MRETVRYEDARTSRDVNRTTRAFLRVLPFTPLVPPLTLLFIRNIGLLGVLPRQFIYVCLFFLLTQLLASLLTPHPLLSAALAVARTIFICALICTGFLVGRAEALRTLVYGYIVLFVGSFISMIVLYGSDFLQVRLSFPYYTPVALGFTALLFIWLITLSSTLSTSWKLGAGLLSLVVLLASGSRGPLLALAVSGVLVLGITKISLRRKLLASGLIAVLMWSVISTVTLPPLQRLLVTESNGRSAVWREAFSVFEAYPLGGVGPYQLGRWLPSQFSNDCALWDLSAARGLPCPSWLSALRGSWIIAHNRILHSLGETGIIGTLGLFAIVITGWAGMWRSRNLLGLALLTSFAVMDLVDTVTLVPSLHFGEVFWLLVGMGAGQLYTPPLPKKTQDAEVKMSTQI